MLAKSKISIINKDRPTKIVKLLIFLPKDMFGVQYVKTEYKTVDNFIVKIGGTVGIISHHSFAYKEGGFYTVINTKDEVFFLNENDVELTGIYKEKSHQYANKTPKFIDCIEIEEFKLDLF